MNWKEIEEFANKGFCFHCFRMVLLFLELTVKALSNPNSRERPIPFGRY
jgi:hypothetical protein